MRPLLPDLAWALMRVAVGGLLAFDHGFAKVFGGKIGGVVNTVAEMGWPFPRFFGWCEGLVEFFGGLLVALGLATRGASALAAFEMAVAVWHHHQGPLAEAELALLYLTAMLCFALQGGGRFGLDGWLRLKFPLGTR
jgi:putative oxidoreductase